MPTLGYPSDLSNDARREAFSYTFYCGLRSYTEVHGANFTQLPRGTVHHDQRAGSTPGCPIAWDTVAILVHTGTM